MSLIQILTRTVLPPLPGSKRRSSAEFFQFFPTIKDEVRQFFWDRVEIPFDTTDEDCWNWGGAKDKNGYGLVTYRQFGVRAHRISVLLAGGELVDGLDMAHSCDNVACVNPRHLTLKTRAGNMADCLERGRFCMGKNHHMTRLSEDDVREIRRRVSGGDSRRAVASDYKISKPYTDKIIALTKRRHVK